MINEKHECNVELPALVINDYESKSVASDTITNIGEITLNKGLYLFICVASFSANATGYRQVHLSSSATGANSNRYSFGRTNANSGIQTNVHFAMLRTISADNTKLYLNVRQNSGNQLTCTAGIQIKRIQ